MHAEWMLAEGVHRHTIWLDEFGVNLWTLRSQGWAPRGQRAVSVLNGQRGQNLTICLVISPVYGLIHLTTIQGGFTNAHFADFLTELDVLLEEEEFVLMVDGARAHLNVPGLGEGHECRFLPPYSPFLNAAEQAGSCL